MTTEFKMPFPYNGWKEVAMCKCGGLPQLINQEFFGATFYGIECIRCNSQGPAKTDPREAIDKWNETNK